MCDFNIAWVGKCKKDSGNESFCDEHKKMKCYVCNEQATNDCSETGQFVCGFPLCSNPECKTKHNEAAHKYMFQH